MKKKYIIELEDNESVYKTINKKDPMIQAFELLSPTPYIKPDLEKVRKEAYKDGYDAGFGRKIDASYHEGLADAWEAARKIAHCALWDDYRTDSGKLSVYTGDVLDYYTASEAIEKLKAYEQEKEMDGLRQNIQTIVDKCGYSLDEIATVLEKMRGEQDGKSK